MQLVYLAGPFTGPSQREVDANIAQAERYGHRIARLGLIPVIPHTMYGTYNGEFSYDYWLSATLELLSRCDAVCVLPGWYDSRGTIEEIREARALAIPVFHLDDWDHCLALKKWIKNQDRWDHDADAFDNEVTNPNRHYAPNLGRAA